ncbi:MULTISPECIES: hybrid sensor histidine kinase/response regulator [Lysobacter]|uniref:hybrid sensor histidine kinase/response regulator n=1 Tax=Lysobacter TaxID=68 RepID=UPI001F421F59|nr:MULTISPECIES: hybrid sensor histidine kinase/response regulator [Lysobacter]UJB18017.1 ATP-binding protein [Lysobacter capsici]UJQ28260.1 ATP-binding protein [Lysobacter gummosus]
MQTSECTRASWLLRGLLMLACAMSAWAAPVLAGLPETPRPRQLTVADGLPSNTINRIAEDRHGYLWIATSEGLARYDGTGYRVWQREQGLLDNYVWAVHVDARNRVWIGTGQSGLAMLDTERKRWRYFNRSNTPLITDDTVWSIASTPDGALWFGTERGGLYRMAEDGKISRYMPRPGDARSLPSEGVANLTVAPDGTLWISTLAGAARWTGHDFERVPDGALSSNIVNTITFENDGTAWFGTPHGVGVRRPDGRYEAAPWASFAPKFKVVDVLRRDRTGQYWFDLPQGLGVGGPDGIEVVPLFSTTSQGLVRPSWSGAYEDREGGLWFASNGHGLWYLPPSWRQFSVLTRRVDDPASMANGSVRGIAAASDGDMWLVGSGGVLDRLDPETGAVEHFAKDFSGGLSLDRVLQDRGGRVWVTYYGGLARIDPATRAIANWHMDDSADAMISGTVELVESRGLIWLIGSDGDVQARDADGHVREAMSFGDRGLPKDLSAPLAGNGPDGELWIAGRGLWRWDESSRRFLAVPGAPTAEDVQAFVFEGKQRLWIAGFGSLDTYRWDGQRLQREFGLGLLDGLPSTEARGLTVDSAGVVWMTTKRGLVRIDPFAHSVRVYGVKDGLPSQEFARAPVPRPGDGRILIGSPEGLVLFDPAVVRPIRSAPSLIVESIEVRRGADRIAFPTFMPDPAQAIAGRIPVVHIADGDRDLRIVARLLSFNGTQSNRYRFRLRNYDPGWVEAGSSGERLFSQLSPGDYRLQIIAKTADNVWSPIQLIELHVDSPWWWSWWAVLGVIAMLLLVLAWILLAHRNRLQRRLAWQRSEHEREVTKQASLAKTRFLATLGHEVRTPMTGVLGMSELLLDTQLDQKQRSYTESIRRAGEHLLRLVNDALDLARIESGRLELADEPFDLRALVDQATDLMRPLAQQRGLTFEIEVAANVPRGLRGDGSRVCQILLNLIGNAIKFTDEGKVSVFVERLVPQGVRFEVADTGPGLNDEQKQRLFRRFEQAEGARTAARYGGSGLGLAISQELAAAMEGHIAVVSSPGQGARFLFDLPLPAAEPPRASVGSVDGTRANAGSTPEPGWRGLQRIPRAVLLVEDDPTVAEVIAGLLRVQGHRVTHVGNGLAALAEVATANFDIALLDLDLPGINGLDLARQLRTQGFTQPLVAVTARADADAEPQAAAAGFDRFLRKPVTGAMLGEAIDLVNPRPAAN